MYSAVIFDMDGTLIDSEKVFKQAWLETTKEHSIPLSEQQYNAIVGVPASKEAEIFKKVTNNPCFPYESLRHGVRKKVEELTEKTGWPIKSGCIETLDYLKSKSVPLAVATNAREARAVDRLKSSKIFDYFEYVVGSDMVEKGKPYPDVYCTASEKLFVKPKHCLAIEDSDIGAQAVLSAGMSLVIIPDICDISLETKQRSKAVFESLGAFLEWMKSID